MTYNQIAYWNLQETKRSNLAREAETARSNRAQEAEAIRANMAREWETNRSNLARESETARADRAYETETKRHNQVSEALGWKQHEENVRANLAREEENRRSNIAREQETRRSNLANEQIRREANVIQQQNVAWDYHIGLLNNELGYDKLNYQYTVDEFNNSWRLFDKMTNFGGQLAPVAALAVNAWALDFINNPNRGRWQDVWNNMPMKHFYGPSYDGLRPQLPLDKDNLLQVKIGPKKTSVSPTRSRHTNISIN